MNVIPSFKDKPILKLSMAGAIKFKSDFIGTYWGKNVFVKGLNCRVIQICVTPSDYSLRQHFLGEYNKYYRDDKEDEAICLNYKTNEFTVGVNLECNGTSLYYTLTGFLDDLGVKYDLAQYK